jgi:hypothetical protein
VETKFDMNQWGYIKDKLKKEYPQLNSSDLDWRSVSSNDLIQNISSKLGKTKKNLLEVIESFNHSARR